MSEETQNDQLVLIGGESGTGKSASLRNIRNKSRWLYCNCEAGKRLPFPNDFQAATVTDPYQVHEAFDYGTDNPDVDGIIVDTATFMMDMFETQYIIGNPNTQKAWGDYAQFWKVLMQSKVARFGKPTIILAHTRTDLNEAAMEMRTQVPIKGSLKNNGLEAYFSTVVAAKKATIKELEKFNNPLLHIDPLEEELGFKHVFQTQLTKATIGERIRSPMGMFTREQTYIDNDAQALLDHLQRYYLG
jgi:hypothetical protein